MNRAAKLTQIDAVETFAGAMRRFQHDAQTALDDVDQQVRRAADWVQHDQKSYWAQEVRRSSEQVAEAKVNLQRCLTLRRIGDYRPSCREEKQALEKAKRRLRVAEEKVEAVRHWSQAVQRAVFKYKGGAGQLARWLEADLPRALATLKRMTRALETYTAVETPEITGDGAVQEPGG